MIKILVVDDETDLELLIKQRFRKQIREQEYEFTFAANGNEALSKLKEREDVSIVLTDINMPEMDGHELAHRAQRIRSQLQVLQLSGRERRRGGYPMIRKPFSLEDLASKMRETTGLC